MGNTTRALNETDKRDEVESLLEARNAAYVAYSDAGQVLAEAASHPRFAIDMDGLRKERDDARLAFIHAEHEWRHALNALEASGVRDAATGLDAELPL